MRHTFVNGNGEKITYSMRELPNYGIRFIVKTVRPDGTSMRVIATAYGEDAHFARCEFSRLSQN